MKSYKLTFKIVTLFYIFLLADCHKAAFSTASNMAKTNKHRSKDPNAAAGSMVSPSANPLTSMGKDDVPDVPIYFQGWVKYFKYLDSTTTDRPKTFFKNTSFGGQIKKEDKDEVFKKN
jgi:hypothetical protein